MRFVTSVRNYRTLVALALTAALLSSCNKKSAPAEAAGSTANPSETPPPSAGTLNVGDNALTSAYPDGLAFAAFPSDGVGDSAAVTAGAIAVSPTLTEWAFSLTATGCAGNATVSTNNCILQCGGAINVNCYCQAQPPQTPGCRPVCPQSGNMPFDCVTLTASNPQSSPAPAPATNNNQTSSNTQCLANTNSPGIIWPSGRQNFDSYAHYKQLNPSTTTLAKETTGTTLDQPAATKILNARARLKGEGSCFSPRLKDSLARLVKNRDDLDGTSADCYQPDWGINGKNQGSDADAEVCIVGFGREQIAETTAYIDFGTGLVEAMLCQAKKSGKADALPEVGVDKDFTSVMKDSVADGDAAITISSASIKRLDDNGGRPVFMTKISFTKTIQPAKLTNISVPIKFQVMLTHSPATDNFSYDGTLSIQHQAALVTNSQACTSSSKVASVKYARSGTAADPNLKFEYRAGQFEGSATSYFDSAGLVNFNVFDASRGGTSSTSGSIGRINYVTFDGNPLNGSGKLAYWVNFGESADEGARGFIFEIEEQDKTLKGCGVAGAALAQQGGLSIRKAIYDNDELEPNGNMRPFLAGNPDNTKVWKQCFKQVSGKYVVDEEKTQNDAAGFDFIASSENPIQPPVVNRAPIIMNLPPPPPPSSSLTGE